MGDDEYDRTMGDGSPMTNLRTWAGPGGGGRGTAAAANALAVLAELDAARARVVAVRELHLNWNGVCRTCVEPREGLHPPYPCATIRALDAAPTPKDDR
jgi:hypothetical protein